MSYLHLCEISSDVTSRIVAYLEVRKLLREPLFPSNRAVLFQICSARGGYKCSHISQHT